MQHATKGAREKRRLTGTSRYRKRDKSGKLCGVLDVPEMNSIDIESCYSLKILRNMNGRKLLLDDSITSR